MDEAGHELSVRVVGDSVSIEGDLCEANAYEFERRLRDLKVKAAGAIKLDLSALDIADGVAVATAVNSIRELLTRTHKVILRGAPQMLGHNLYRVGLLGADGAIELVDMRLDEASGL